MKAAPTTMVTNQPMYLDPSEHWISLRNKVDFPSTASHASNCAYLAVRIENRAHIEDILVREHNSHLLSRDKGCHLIIEINPIDFGSV